MTENIEYMITFEEDDLFSRKKIADNLTKIIEETSKPFAIAIDSYWGSGKSTFIKKWKNQLEKNGETTIYLDAWENDYYIDPIIPLIGKLGIILKLNDAKMKDVKMALATVLKEIVKSVSNFIDIDKILQSFENETRTNMNIYNSLKDEKELIFNKLSELTKNNNKVYFFIDELDRCKPLFAINLLERIKHFLSIPNFVFVFTIDLNQLGQSIKQVYGDIDSNAYFRKFFDMTFNLPNPEKEEYFQFLFKKNQVMDIYEKEYVRIISKFIKNIKIIGLRECEKIFEIIRIANHEIIKQNENEYIFPFIILKKVTDPTTYKKLISKEIPWDISLFDSWNVENVYSKLQCEPYVYKLIRCLGAITLKERQKEYSEQFGQSSTINSEIKNGFTEHAINIIEFTNLF